MKIEYKCITPYFKVYIHVFQGGLCICSWDLNDFLDLEHNCSLIERNCTFFFVHHAATLNRTVTKVSRKTNFCLNYHIYGYYSHVKYFYFFPNFFLNHQFVYEDSYKDGKPMMVNSIILAMVLLIFNCIPSYCTFAFV